ncbi:MAG: DNA polymerase III subunit delta [Rhodobacteraceae bacterium]|nr:DNA polymerase III subunit delta [Paracoccaceae bacterium]
MKLSGRQARTYFGAPDPNSAGLLIHGADAMRVALHRQDMLAALLGPDAGEEMRLASLAATDLRKDPAALADAVQARGFFPGPRAVHIEGGMDGLTALIGAALDSWQPGDAQIVVTAGQLPARSKLRKRFEDHPSARSAAVYDDPLGRDEIAAMLRDAGLPAPSREADGALEALAAALDPGDFRQTVEKLALYTRDSDTPATAEDVAAVAPLSTEAGVDDLTAAVAGGDSASVGPLLRRLQTQGTQPVALCIAAARHFRQLLAAACHPEGPSKGLAAARVFGPRRDRMAQQLQIWSPARLDQAIGLLVDTDLTLRSPAAAPQMAVVERALIRLAMLARRPD